MKQTFLATFGVSRVWVVGLFVVALALLAVGGLLVKTHENKSDELEMFFDFKSIGQYGFLVSGNEMFWKTMKETS